MCMLHVCLLAARRRVRANGLCDANRQPKSIDANIGAHHERIHKRAVPVNVFGCSTRVCVPWRLLVYYGTAHVPPLCSGHTYIAKALADGSRRLAALFSATDRSDDADLSDV